MNLEQITRISLEVGYGAVAGLGLYGFIHFKLRARRIISGWWAIIGLLWILWFTALTPSVHSIEPILQSILINRLLHFPIVGLGITTILIFKDREREVAEIWALLDSDSDG